MTFHAGPVPAGTSLYIPFSTYAGSTGASATCTGLAVTDIEIYKNGSTTQRSSDAGIALLDTDGIDFDGITGLHGFSIDLSDNTDASFYAVGSWYWVVVSAITVDSQTVTFLAATFRIAPAESITGYPKTDQHALKGDAQSATDLQDFADAGYDPATNKVQGVVLVDTLTTYTGNTPQTGDSYARIGATGSGLTSLAQASVWTATRGTYLDICYDAASQLLGVGSDVGDEIRGFLGLGVADLDTQLGALPTNAELATALGTGTWATAIPWNAAWGAEVQSEAADAITAAGLAMASELLLVKDRVSYCLTVLVGACSDAGTAAETYVHTIGGETFTVDFTGLDATGNRTTTTLSKV